MGELLVLLFLAVCFLAPPTLTIFNVLFLVKPAFAEARKRLCLVCDVLTLVLGAGLSWLWIGMVSGVTEKEWDEAVILGGVPGEEYHTVISGEYGGWFALLAVLAGGCVLVMHFLHNVRKPPLVSVLLVGGVNLGNVLGLLWILQTAVHAFDALMIVTWIFPLNYALVSVRRIRNEVHAQLRQFSEADVLPESGWQGFLYRTLSRSRNWLWVGFAAMLPIISVLLVLMLLFGQTPDALVKAFTMTADWTFSTQIPPPPEYYSGHYLCTVAAGGHRNIVKPVRMGVRRGEKIIVNRQLCVANAFEDLLEDRLPGLHKTVRRLYDKYGYPLAKHITTPARADAVYLLMKPLEWGFLIVLYLFDTDPESRIAVQYTGVKYQKLMKEVQL